MILAKYKTILCDGATKEAIIDIFLDYHCLLFEREEVQDNLKIIK